MAHQPSDDRRGCSPRIGSNRIPAPTFQSQRPTWEIKNNSVQFNTFHLSIESLTLSATKHQRAWLSSSTWPWCGTGTAAPWSLHRNRGNEWRLVGPGSARRPPTARRMQWGMQRGFRTYYSDAWSEQPWVTGTRRKRMKNGPPGAT